LKRIKEYLCKITLTGLEMKKNLSIDELFELMRENFEYMQNSPLVKSLRKENRRLAKENKLLMSIIKDFHVSKVQNKEKKPVVIDLSNDEDEDVELPPVKIKIEKTEKTGENIVYELIEKEEAPVSVPQEEAVEEEEEEEVEEEEEEEEIEEEEEEEELVEEEEKEGGAGSGIRSANSEEHLVSPQEEEEGRDLKGTAGSLEEDETEVYEVTIRGKKYFTTDQKNGKIYAMDKDGDVGDEIGSFVNGVAKI